MKQELQTFEQILKTQESQQQYTYTKFIPIFALALLTIPVLIFLAGWFRLIYATPLIFLILVAVFLAFRHISAVWVPEFTRKNLTKGLIIIVIILIWVLLSGIGGISWQNGDHIYRNALFEELVNKPWPVLDSSETMVMVYYIAFWLPSAVMGKLLGLGFGYLFQLFWAFLLIFTSYYLICAFFKKVMIWPLVVFIFFSGMDILVSIYETGLPDFLGQHIEWHGSRQLQFSSTTTQLFWVFNQALPAWLATLLLFTQKNIRLIGLIVGVTALASPLPVIGLIFPVLYIVLFAYPKLNGKSILRFKEYIVFVFKELCTFENVVGILVFLITLIYFNANLAGSSFGLRNYDSLLNTNFLIWSLCEFVLLYIAVLWSGIRTPLLHIVLFTLFFTIVGKVGYDNDFIMRASIPALLLLQVFVCAALQKSFVEKKKYVFIFLVTILLIGSITPANEMIRTLCNNKKIYKNEIPHTKETIDFWNESGYMRDNFVGMVDETFYGKYFMPRK